MSLYATVLDLELQGCPPSALSRVRTAETYHLAMGSALADDYLRGRYQLPIPVQSSSTWNTFPFPATGSTGTGMVTASLTTGAQLPQQAYGLVVTILSATTYKLSLDGGVTYYTLSATIPNGSSVDLSIGVTLAFASGTYYTGDVFKISISYGSLTAHTCALVTYRLLGYRGVAPDGNAYDPIRDQYKQALDWLKNVRDLRVDPGLTNPNTQDGSDVFIEDPEVDTSSRLETDRRWQGVLGRSSIGRLS